MEKEKKTTKLVQQLNHYEGEIKDIRNKNDNLISSANEKVKKAAAMAIELKHINTSLEVELDSLKDQSVENTETIKDLNKRVKEQNRVIADLRDVIEHREQQIAALNNKL